MSWGIIISYWFPFNNFSIYKYSYMGYFTYKNLVRWVEVQNNTHTHIYIFNNYRHKIYIITIYLPWDLYSAWVSFPVPSYESVQPTTTEWNEEEAEKLKSV